MSTRSPGDRSPSVLIAIVTPMTSAVNQSAPWSTTVRHTPLTEMESPCFASLAAIGARTVRRAASPVLSNASTSPRSSMMPVNMSVLPCCDEKVVAELLHAGEREPARVGQGRDAEVADREPVAAQQGRREVDRVLVGQS